MRKTFSCLLAIAITLPVLAQKSRLPLSADSLATGNYKDVLSSFFQLAFNKFTGPQKELRFSSNPYAVMARMDTSLLNASAYYKYRHLRDLNFGFAARLDSNFRFNGFSSDVKYALINRRDETVSKAFIQNILDDERTQTIFTINTELDRYISKFDTDTAHRNRLQAEKVAFTRGKINFGQLSQELQGQIKEIALTKNLPLLQQTIDANPNFNLKKTAAEVYADIKETINNKALWTIGLADTTYKDQFMFSNLVLSSEYIKGIDKMKARDLELNIKATMQFTDDSLRSGRDLRRNLLMMEGGMNLVLKNPQTLKSFFECKFSGAYYHNFGSLYTGENRDYLNLIANLRIRVYNDIWLPLEIRYDPVNHNVFGFLHIRANFTALGDIVKGK